MCNLKRDQKWQIPVIGHNSAGYDSHLFVRDLCGEEGEPTDIEVIPENEQKYMSFSTKRYVEVDKGNGETFTRTIILNFIDSFKHLQASLDTLVKGLPEEEHYQMRKNFDATTVTLRNRKGIYPYEHLHSLERFEERQLPPMYALSKMYAFTHLDGEEKKAKVNFDHFERCLMEKKNYMCQFYTLRSRDHREHIALTKTALSYADCKRYILEDGSHETLAWGHYAIPKEQQIT